MSGRLPAYRITALFALLLLLSACGERTNGPPAAQRAADTVPGKLKLLVADSGIHRVAAHDLAEHGIDVDYDLAIDNISLRDKDGPVPFLVDEDGLVFYGRAADSRYFAERPYILEMGGAGKSMAIADAPTSDSPLLQTIQQTVHLEENNSYVSEARQEEEVDVWFWSKLTQGDRFDAEFTLPFISEDSATLRFNAWGFTHNPQVENDHDFDVLVNDVNQGQVAWDGQTSYTGEIQLPAGILKNGANTITLDNRAEGASFLDITQINWLELDYSAPPTAINDRLDFTAADGRFIISGLSGKPVVLDISDPTKPATLDSWRYENGQVEGAASKGMHVSIAGPRGTLSPRLEPLLASDLRDKNRQADLIIIAADELAPALEPLVAARTAEGLNVVVAPVGEIYDTFGYGAATPQSIKDFVVYANEEWQTPQPRYLLLVGDATSDYLGYLGDVPDNIVPSPMVPVQFSGETVSDAQYADINEDGRPDLAVGRWPLRTYREVEDLVQRTLTYEQEQAGSHAIFATDGSEATFSSIANRLIRGGELSREKVEQRDGLSADEIGELWREGTWLVTYIGHGSIDRWGKDGLFSLDRLNELEGNSAPIVLHLTCLTGLFSHPDQESLAEAMLLYPDGPVQIIAATSLTFSSHQEPFAAELLRRLQDPDTERMGDAFLAAKQVLDIEDSDGYREVSDTFSLIGDPSARIARP